MKVGFERTQLVAPEENELQEPTFGLTVHEDRSRLKAAAPYSTMRNR